jgi:hypothetical protein
MNKTHEPVLGGAVIFVVNVTRPAGTCAQAVPIAPQGRRRILQHIGSVAKKCQFPVSLSPYNETTATLLSPAAFSGAFKDDGFPLARDLTAGDRPQARV